MDSRKKALADLLGAVNKKKESGNDPVSLNDLLGALYAEPDKKKRKKMIKDFAARHSDAAAFLAENEDLINAEAEAALIGAAVGGTVTEKKVTYKGGRRHETTVSRKIPPNIAALNFLLKNRMPDKYSDKPKETVEIEDISEVEEMIYGNKAAAGNDGEKDDTV